MQFILHREEMTEENFKGQLKQRETNFVTHPEVTFSPLILMLLYEFVNKLIILLFILF